MHGAEEHLAWVTRVLGLVPGVIYGGAETASETRPWRQPGLPEAASRRGRSRCPSFAWQILPAHRSTACSEPSRAPALEAAPGMTMPRPRTWRGDTSLPSSVGKACLSDDCAYLCRKFPASPAQELNHELRIDKKGKKFTTSQRVKRNSQALRVTPPQRVAAILGVRRSLS